MRWLPALLLLYPLALLAEEDRAPQKVGTVTLKAKVRDFLEYNKGGHPDFENFLPLGDYDGCKDAVYPIISENGASTGFDKDNKTPSFNPEWDCSPFDHFAGPQYFKHWFDDYPPDINRAFEVGLTFDIFDDCKIRYENRNFFPIDDNAPKRSLNVPALETFGHLQEAYPEHNFGFTMEFHTTFTYIRGANQTFHFEGDDDVWVFINDSLLIDLGGLHSPLSASINLDQLPDGFLRNEKTYDFDFFFAERHSYGSNLIIESGLLFGLKFDGIPGTDPKSRKKFMACYDKVVEIPTPIINPNPLKRDNEQFRVIAKKEHLHISIANPQKLKAPQLRIYKTTGEEIHRATFFTIENDNTITCTVPELSAGYYIARFTDSKIQETTRFVVK